ncbi:SOUL family heme-binding protein [Pseudidiomarina sp.]|uniref:SOUL family heme-binding protein n=1 Tax=Pseudidiomarina sp. TaxID=2081707 RepID=UPI003A971B93
MRPFILICLASFMLLTPWSNAVATEEPKYDVIKQDGEFELRRYAPMIVAEVAVAGSMEQATGRGFRVLADYIFGNNRVPGATNAEIAMTTPVTMVPRSETIEMTSPVTMQAGDGQWLVQFVMPSQYTMDSLPKPNNPDIEIIEHETQYYAVIRFSGFTGNDKVAKKSAALKSWLESQDLTPIGAPELARYDPPWTLPFLRRNEVKIRYQPAA